MPPKPAKVGLIFSLAPNATMEQALSALLAAKVDVERPLDEIGVILGAGRLSQLNKLRKLPMFQSVDVDSTVQIAPPDGPIQ